MNTITIRTPAKINLTLDILHKLPNGYHAIRSIVIPIALYDTITVTRTRAAASAKRGRAAASADGGREKNHIGLTISGPTASDTPHGHTNIVYRAAELFFKTAAAKTPPHTHDIKIKLHKRIPVRSGLAGGSSDAAATLLALNALYQQPLTPKKLHALALQLGTEVPYFLNPIPALVTGRGERITPIYTHKQASKISRTPFAITLHLPKAKKPSTKKQYQSINLATCATHTHDTNKLFAALEHQRVPMKAKKIKLPNKNSTHKLTWNPAWNKLLHNDFAQLYALKKGFTLSGSGPMQYKLKQQHEH